MLEDGGYYIGQFKNNKINGNGIVYDKNNEEVYEGEFVDGKREGHGKYYISEEYYYEGEFKNNEFHGKGEFISVKENRTIISANFEKGKKNGEGVIYLSNGDVRFVEYKDDEEVREVIKYIRDVSVSELFKQLGEKIKDSCNIF